MTRGRKRGGSSFVPSGARPERPRAGSPTRAPPKPGPAAPQKTGPRRPPGRPAEGGAQNVARIYGFHSVEAALKAPRRELIRLYATEAAAERLRGAIDARGVETRVTSLEEVAERAPRGAVHQGVVLEARPLAPVPLSDLPARGLVLVLDQVTDPHNVGAILRTAAAFAVDALVTTERHTPEFAGALAKAASGGLEHVPICLVTNLSRALTEIGDLGYFRVGLASDASTPLEALPLSRPLALALGAEDRGLRRLTREGCDVLARLDLPGPIQSLNVSNAAAIALALCRQKIGPA